MKEVVFFLSEGDYDRVKDLTQIEEFALHHPQLVWVWTTYLRLKQIGYPVKLSCQMPGEGIVVISAINIDLLKRPSRNVFLITTIADSPPPFFGQVVISQNPQQYRDYPNLFRFPVWQFLPHWPQPGIVPRLRSRGDKFERLVFMGHHDQLAPYFTSEECRKDLQTLGLTLEINEQYFHDYSTFDAVIAIRDFTATPYFHKPFTKLLNGWQAGVPVIVGMESSFQAIKESELDFIAVKSKKEFLQALQKLKCDPNLRAAMIQNGLRRSEQYSEENILKAWEKFLFVDAQNYYTRWLKKSRVSKEINFASALIARSFRSLKKKVRRYAMSVAAS